jgi:hypothetical protein
VFDCQPFKYPHKEREIEYNTTGVLSIKRASKCGNPLQWLNPVSITTYDIDVPVIINRDVSDAIYNDDVSVYISDNEKWWKIDGVYYFKSGGDFEVLGNFDCDPLVMVYGSGDVSVTINSNVFTVKGVSEYVVVDSVLKDCYKGTSPMNSSMAGDFPKLKAGRNSLSWSGNVSRIHIVPNICYV